MKTFMIKLGTIKDVQEFVSISTMFDGDIDIISNRYIVDGKSILGLLGLDLSNPIEVKIYNCTEEMENNIAKFIVKNQKVSV